MMILPIGNAFAYRNDCSFATEEGEYCYNAGNKKDCPSGCYCVGGKKFAVGDDSDRNPNTACAQKKASVKDHLEKAGIFYCPSDFPYSQSMGGHKNGAKSINECYYNSSIDGRKVLYAEVECPAGQYLPRLTNKCVLCSQSVYCLDCDKASPNARGYICEGTKGKKVTPKDVDQGVKKCEGDSKPDSMQMSCVSDKKSCEPGKYLKAYETSYSENGVIHMPSLSSFTCVPCPNDGHTICPGGGPWKKETYDQGKETCGDQLVPNSAKTECVVDTSVTVNCPVGTYLPAKSNSCWSCNDASFEIGYNHVCKGGTFHMSNDPQGVGEKCEAPSKPDHKAGKCTRDTVRCIEGTYLKANGMSSNDCEQCPNNKLCPGGYFEIGWNTPQGLLDKSKITVEPGYYLPKGSNESKKCTSSSKYCPGGDFEPSTSRDQGTVDCPQNSHANDAKTACIMTLSKKQLMYGIAGNKYAEKSLQCWTKTGDEYRKCMGFSGGSYTPTSSGGITYKPIGNLHMNLTLPAANAVQAAAVQASANFIDK